MHQKSVLPKNMDANMSLNTRDELLEKLRRRYKTAGKEHKGKLIDQAVEMMGYHRKSAIRALGEKPVRVVAMPAIVGRPRVYEPELLLPALRTIWLAGQQPCGKRLVAMMPEWVPAYEAFHRGLKSSAREQLVEASSATLDRLLAPLRAQCRKPPVGTSPGTMLRQSVPIRGGAWREDEPGWTEVDTVLLCGGSTQGETVTAVDNVDICTGWVEVRAMWGRGQHGTVEQLGDMEKSQPFVWKGMDSDNGGEFMNLHVMSWCQEGRARPIFYTRSRPYKSNDNAHVEQKNWTHVRHWFGYERYDNPEAVGLINELARGELGQFTNLFSANLKLRSRERDPEGREKRVYEKAQTPLARVLASAHVAEKEKARLRELKGRLNPFGLEKKIQKKLKKIERVRRGA